MHHTRLDHTGEQDYRFPSSKSEISIQQVDLTETQISRTPEFGIPINNFQSPMRTVPEPAVELPGSSMSSTTWVRGEDEFCQQIKRDETQYALQRSVLRTRNCLFEGPSCW